MKKILALSLLLLGVSLQSAKAYNVDGCSVWLCLPSGFPTGCAAAKSYAIKEIRKFRNPMPSWSSCSAEGEEYKSAQPYTYNIKNVAYFNYGRGVVKRTGLYGRAKCPSNGNIIETKETNSYRERWLVAKCHAGAEITTTLNDNKVYLTRYGASEEEVNNFKPKLLGRWRIWRKD